MIEIKEKKRNILTKFLRSQDSHGHPIQLTFDGETQYQSPLGGVLSMFSKALVLSYFIYLVKLVIGREQYTVMGSSIKQNFDTSQKLLLNDQNFDIGIGMECLTCYEKLGN
jgi:hypothetical protein